MSIAGLVLAAGGGSRFGGPKALVEFRGSTLVRRAARTLASGGCDPVFAVVGAQAPRVLRSVRPLTGCVVVNPRWQEGLATSLRAGLDALGSTDAAAAVVALVDQPLVTPALVARLIATWRDGNAVVAAAYGGAVRTPVLLDRSIWAEVMRAAHDDQGARAWLRSHPERVVAVACDDVGAPDDIDTEADLQRLVRSAQGL